MNYIITLEDGTTLYHHGIKNQKWGVRRYQYEDGTLTPEGRKRYLKGERYRVKEIAKAERYYDKQISKSKERYEIGGQRIDKKKLDFYMKNKQKEIDAIKRMTTDQLLDEKHSYNVKLGTELLKTWAMAGFNPLAIPSIPIANGIAREINKVEQKNNPYMYGLYTKKRLWKSRRRGAEPYYKENLSSREFNEIADIGRQVIETKKAS